MSQLIEKTDKTPIELALPLDEMGETTASALYSWLELDPTHYARWCKQNITENPWAIQGEDYFIVEESSNGAFAIEGERENTGFAGNPNPKKDYHITANFAKRLAMLTKSERGEAARRYFIKCEEGLKVTIKQYNDLLKNYEKLNSRITQLEESTEENYTKLDCRLACMESNTSVSGGKLSPWVKEVSSDILELANHCGYTVKQMYSRVIERMEEIYGFLFNRYYQEYCAIHPQEKSVWRIIVIEYFDDLKEAFEDTYIKIGKEVGLYPDNTYNPVMDFEF